MAVKGQSSPEEYGLLSFKNFKRPSYDWYGNQEVVFWYFDACILWNRTFNESIKSLLLFDMVFDPASSTNKLDKQGKFSMLLYYLKDEMGYVV